MTAGLPARKFTPIEQALVSVFEAYGWTVSQDGETGDMFASLYFPVTILGLSELARNLTAEMEANP